MRRSQGKKRKKDDDRTIGGEGRWKRKRGEAGRRRQENERTRGRKEERRYLVNSISRGGDNGEKWRRRIRLFSPIFDFGISHLTDF